jgi:D-glycero-D-manno-heptose 1,7-bisphosphate phosphatase
MRRAIFLDRDGTIIRDNGYVSDVKHVKFYPSAIDSMLLVQRCFSLFIVTNQTGIGKGLITAADAEKINMHILDILAKHKVIIKEVYCCAHTDEDACECKKPGPYFLFKARDTFGIDLAGSFVIGDHPSDMELACNAGCSGLYLLTGHGSRHRKDIPGEVPVFRNLNSACRYAVRF